MTGAAPHIRVIWNARAGRGRPAVLRRTLDALAARGLQPELSETAYPRHAATLAEEVAGRDGAIVVAAGGDGTIAEVVHGLRGGTARLGILPIGTANVFAQELRLPFDPIGIADALASGRGHAVWPGLLRTPQGERLFLQMASAGLDAQVVHRVSPGLKRLAGRTAYVWQTVVEAVRFRPGPLRVVLDGQAHAAGSVIITKGRLYAGRFTLAPQAAPAEPGFHVVLFTRPGALAALGSAAALPLGLLPRLPGVVTVRASLVEVSGTENTPVQADGDAVGWLPLRVQDAPHPITVVGFQPRLTPLAPDP